MIFIYFLIGLLASTIGAISGLGGGVFIKPILDFMGDYPVATIGILSSTTVLAMSSVSLWTRRREVKQMRKIKAILLASGAVMGGLIGKGIFTSLIDYTWIGTVQTTLLILIFSSVLFYVQFKEKFPRFYLKDRRLILFMGLALGILSAFLDIGGGPHNIALLSIFFAMHAKQAALYSLFIICFSQLSSLILMIVSVDILSYDLTMLPGMIIGGILGGAIGSHLSKWLSMESVEVIFKVSLICLVILNVYNLYIYL